MDGDGDRSGEECVVAVSENENVKRLLGAWDRFVESRALPYYRDDHQLMMRQLLDRYPPGKLTDLSDRDLAECVNLDSDDDRSRLRNSFRYFLGHFDQFLEQYGLNEKG